MRIERGRKRIFPVATTPSFGMAHNFPVVPARDRVG